MKVGACVCMKQKTRDESSSLSKMVPKITSSNSFQQKNCGGKTLAPYVSTDLYSSVSSLNLSSMKNLFERYFNVWLLFIESASRLPCLSRCFLLGLLPPSCVTLALR